jgi:SAM-dependent methyltransferase
MVMEALDAGFAAYGCDLYDGTWLDRPELYHPADGAGALRLTQLGDAGFGRRTVDVLTMFDVLEHSLDPLKLLRQAAGILRRDGLLVIELPDFHLLLKRDGIKGRHVKPGEHLWYPTAEELEGWLDACDLQIVSQSSPHPDRWVIYARPNPDTVLEVEVEAPTGLGDTHWLLLKLDGLKELEAPCRLNLIIPGTGDPELIFRAEEFLRMCTVLDTCRLAIAQPVIVDLGNEDVAVPHYVLLPNSHLDHGNRIELWHPEWRTNFDYEIEIPQEAKVWAKLVRDRLKGKVVLFYASSRAWTHTITNAGGWTVHDWQVLGLALNAVGIVPVLIGKAWDNDMSADVASTAEIIDMTGKTNVGQVLALFHECQAVIGMCSGITILGAHVGARSIVFWPEVGKGLKAMMEFHKDFQADWIAPERLTSRTYIPLSLGAFTVDDVIAQLREWRVL